jgi:hypothetical protein
MHIRIGIVIVPLLAASACQQAEKTERLEPQRMRFTAGAAPGQFSIDLGEGEKLEARQIGPIGGAMVAKDPGGAPVGLAVAIGAADDGVAIIGYSVEIEAGWTAPDKLCGAAPTTGIAILYRDDAPDVLAAFKGDALGGAATTMCGLRDVSAEEPPLTAIQ